MLTIYIGHILFAVLSENIYVATMAQLFYICDCSDLIVAVVGYDT